MTRTGNATMLDDDDVLCWAVLNRGGHILMTTVRELRADAIRAALSGLAEGQMPQAQGWRLARRRYALRCERVAVRVWEGY
jgi:hypothetical protein